MSKEITISKFHTYTGHTDCVYSLEVVDNQQFLSSGADGMVVLWDLEQLDKGTIIAKIPSSVYAMHFIPDSSHLVIGQNFDGIHVIDFKLRKEIGSLKLTKSHIFDIKSDRENLYVATGEGRVYVVDRRELLVKNVLEGSDKSARVLALDDHRIMVGYSDHHVRVYDKLHCTLTNEFLAHQNSVFTLTFDPLGKYVLSAGRDAHLKIWDSQNMDLKEDIVAHMYAINNIDYSPDGQHFVTCSMDKSIKIWDSRSFKLKKVIDRARHAGHGTSVNKLKWMTFNNFLVSCSDDHTVSVWDIKFGNKE